MLCELCGGVTQKLYTIRFSSKELRLIGTNKSTYKVCNFCKSRRNL